MSVYTKFFSSIPGSLGQTNRHASSPRLYVDYDNYLVDPEFTAQVWSALIRTVAHIDAEGREDMIEQEKERYLHSIAPPLLFVYYTTNPAQFTQLRTIAFEVLRTPAFCLCSFGEMALHGLQLTSGYVVDFGFSHDQEHSEFFASQDKPEMMFVEYVKNGKRKHYTTCSRKTVAEAILQCYRQGGKDKDALQNIILIGSNPVAPETFMHEISAVITNATLKAYIPPESELVIWKGASLFALTTFSNPSFFYPHEKMSKRVENGKWMDKLTYAINCDSYPGQQTYLRAANIDIYKYRDDSCIIA